MKYIIDNTTDINKLDIKDNDILYFKKGIYKIKLSLKANNLEIIGEDRDNTIITNDDHYHKIMADFNECNTFRTYTLEILGDNVSIKDITIINSCRSNIHGQAVALAVYGDKFRAINTTIKGEQDTLFTGPLPDDLVIRYTGFLTELNLKSKPSRQSYINSTIIGDVDFIFGSATALFNNCLIQCINQKGYVSAPSHSKNLEYGYLFNNCQIEASIDSNFYLARPWRDYGLAYFINCKYQNILEDGFNKWNNTNRDKTCRFYEYNDINYNRIYFLNKLNKDEANDYLNNFLAYLNK